MGTRIVVVAWLVVGGTACGQAVRPDAPANANPEVGGQTLDHWIKEIEDNDPSVRENAIKMVALLGPQAKRAVPALIRQLNTSPNDLSPLTNAAIALGLIKPEDPKHVKDAVTALTRLLDSTQGIVRFQAANSLGHLGPNARSAVGKLAVLSRDPNSWEIRKAAAFALGRAGLDERTYPDMKALVALVDAIDDRSKEVRIEALQGLINLGPPVTPQDQAELKRRLEGRVRVDKDKYVAIWVRVALMRMDVSAINEANLGYIARQLKATEPPGINADASRALGVIGPAAKSKVPDLIEATRSPDVSLVTWSAWALGRMGADGKAALPALNQLLESSDQSVKAAAQEAIKEINAPPRRIAG
jgi:HEAT repeat protein